MEQTTTAPIRSNDIMTDRPAREHVGVRVGGLILAGAIVLVFALVLSRFWVPVHGGVDQNGYMVGGKQIATTGSMALRLHRADTGEIDPLQFVSPMWVGFGLGTEQERFIPKYPVGLPLIYAGMLKLGGESAGVRMVHLVSPVSMVLALFGCFLLARRVLGSMAALGVLVLLTSSPATISLTNNPNSHAATLLLVVWGMFLLVRWHQGAGVVSGMAGAFLAGAAISIRYTEGLLILPIGLAALFHIERLGWWRWKAWLEAAGVVLAWCVPLAALLTHNQLAMGTWTGYDPTNESTGFGWKSLLENWDTMLRQLYQMGLMLLFPLSLAGLLAGLVWHWRLGAILAAWIVPSLLLYTAYYWAPDGQTAGYARFFLTIFPPMAICAIGVLLWPIQHIATAHPEVPRRRMCLATILATVLLLSLSVLFGIATSENTLQNDYRQRKNIEQRAQAVLGHVPAGSVLFSDGRGLTEHLQLVGDYVLYSPEVFTRRAIDRLEMRSPDDPAPMDPGRAKYLAGMMQSRTQGELDALRDEIVTGAIASGRRVFVFMQGTAGLRRPPGWQGFNARTMSLVPVAEGIDPYELTRAFPNGRAGLANRALPTTMPRAPWQLMEITLKPKPTTRPMR